MVEKLRAKNRNVRGKKAKGRGLERTGVETEEGNV